jgi:serine/threonine-protein kinase
MGIVCLAERDDVGKQVALKLVAGGLGSPERIGRFFLERRVLAQLEHPHIAGLLDAGLADDGTPWLAMEYVPGRAIDQYCDGRRLTVEHRLALFEKVARAVGYAHRHLIVHRDLKPSNILVGEDGEPRLVDFGIAKLLADSAGGDATATGIGLMTPQYASPEQIRGEPITTSSDIYQLGALLFELVTGQRPHPARAGRPEPVALDPVGRPSQATGRDPAAAPARGTTPEGLRRRLAGDVDTIVLKATHPEPPLRYPTAEQLADDVARHLQGLPVVARRATAGYRIRKFVARHQAGTAVAAVALIGLLGFAVTLQIKNRRIEAERVRAETVSDLLANLFASANPEVAESDTLTVRTVLDRGAERVRADSTLDPVVAARLLTVIGSAYNNLGQLKRAVEVGTEAVGLLHRSVPRDHPARLLALRQLAAWMAEDGAKADAYPLADEALAIARTLGPSRRSELAEILHAAGHARQLGGDDAAARPLLEEALAVRYSLPDSGGLDVTATLVNLGYLANTRGDKEAAAGYLRKVLELRRARLGPDHVLTAKSMLDLANLFTQNAWLDSRAEGDEAERLVREATAIERRKLVDPVLRINGYASMARVLSHRGKLAEAEAAQREIIALSRQAYGDAHGNVTTAIANLAGFVQRAGRLDEAAELHREAIRRYAAAGVGRNVAVSTANLAWTERLRLRFAESEALYRQAIPVLDSLWRGTARVSATLVDFGIVLGFRGKDREAEAVFRRAVEVAETGASADSGNLYRARSFLGQSLLAAGQYARAEPLLLGPYEWMRKSLGPAHQYTRLGAENLARLYQKWGRPADAERYRRP